MKESEYGKDDLSLVSTLDSLAFINIVDELFLEAERMYQRVVTIKKHHYGEKHSDIVSALRTLGLFYHTANRLKEAEKTLLEVKAIEESILSSEYEKIITYTNLSGVYGSLGKLNKQEEVLLKILEITLRETPETPLNVAEAMHNLGVFYLHGIENNEKALMYLEKARAIHEKLEEKDYFFHSLILNNISDVYEKTGDTDSMVKYRKMAEDINFSVQK